MAEQQKPRELSDDEKAIFAALRVEFTDMVTKRRMPDRAPSAEELAAISEEVRQHIEELYSDLAQAKAADAHVHMEGDWGGQIYLSVPARQIACSEETLLRLLDEIDGREWGCNEGGASIHYQKGIKELGISGGMGGGEITDGLWVHGTLEGLKPVIQEVLDGKRSSIKENS